jgi:chromosome segregation ATPase
MYQRQLNLNQLLERSEKDRDRYKTENEVLKHENGSLKAEIERVRETLTKQIDSLKKTVRGAYESLTNTVKAVGMLKYDKEDGYGIDNLTKKQEKLIDGIAEYGSHWAKTDGFPELAEDMQKHVGISKGLRETIEPPKIEHHHDRGGRSM